MSYTAGHDGGRRDGFPWVFLACVAVALAVLVSLGTWQVQRLAWKEGLLATIEARLASSPVDIAAIEAAAAAGEDVDYRPVQATGRFLNESERHFFATWQGGSGFFVHTPLELADGRVVFVNRGFVPYDRKDPATRPEGQRQGEAAVTGLARARLDGKPSFIVPENTPETNVFYWKDLDAMAASAGLAEGTEVLPFFIDAGDAPNPGGLPIGGVTLVDMPNNHLQYAVTWYGLALALAVVSGVWFWKRRGQARGEGSP